MFSAGWLAAMPFDRLRRREFITVLGASAAAWPLAARAQPRERHIAVLMGYAESDSEAQANIAAFREGLEKYGWVEDRNIRLRHSLGNPRRCGDETAVCEGTRRATARSYS